jgi:hypothetical protein
MRNHPIAFVLIYAMQSVDQCSCDTRHHVDAAGNVALAHDGAWEPGEPELHTEQVQVLREDVDGSNQHLLAELTGDQHRDLEDRGRLDAFLERLAHGDAPAAALSAVVGSATA